MRHPLNPTRTSGLTRPKLDSSRLWAVGMVVGMLAWPLLLGEVLVSAPTGVVPGKLTGASQISAIGPAVATSSARENDGLPEFWAPPPRGKVVLRLLVLPEADRVSDATDANDS
jgi:hypothetical protein